MKTEADTCRIYVLPKIYAAGWSNEQIREQKTFTDGRIITCGEKPWRKKAKRADYILNISPNYSIAVIEAKSKYKNAGDGLQQAKEYAEILGINFAYSTNGLKIIEHDYITGLDKELDNFPSPYELWERLKNKEKIGSEIEGKLLEPCFNLPGKQSRYYQEIAINRAIKEVLQGKNRILLTLATGTGKTYIAFQIIWKLWSQRWNAKNEYRKPKVLYLADRNVLIDSPKDNIFSVFDNARWKIKGIAVKSREIYFSTYQSIAEDKRRPGLYKDYAPDFFDLIIVDECHRGSAKDSSNWRDILEYFSPAVQIGMTATPKREDNIDTYRYFGNPIYTYSLKNGIEDGFLAPYKVHRIVTSVDATGWRPYKGQLDKYNREVPDQVYVTTDFETLISFQERTNAVARHLTEYLKNTDRFAKTIIFCVDQEHAEQMRMALNNLNSDIVKEYPDYVCRIVSEEGEIGKSNLEKFMDVETKTPSLVTTSKLLSTGVDVPTCQNIVIFKNINSMTEFKQIIGRGTRVREDYGKLYFDILDYTGSASRLFADPEYDGEPEETTEEELDVNEENENDIGTGLLNRGRTSENNGEEDDSDGFLLPKKYYINGGIVEIVADTVSELDPQGKRLRVIKYTEYTREQVRSMYTSVDDFKSKWTNADERSVLFEMLEERGISSENLVEITKKYNVDPFDLLCHIAYNIPLKTRKERAELVKNNKPDFFEKYSSVARDIINEMLDKYIEFGFKELNNMDILKVPPISNRGNVLEISNIFGGIPELKNTMTELQNIIYES